MKDKNIGIKNILFIILAATLAFIIGLGINVSFDLEEKEEPPFVMEDREVEYYDPKITHEKKIIETVEDSIEAVVSIEFEDKANGSGFFVSSDGYIITNRHVVQEKGSYQVITHKGETLEAEVVSRDPVRDLAFLRVEGEDFRILEIGDSDGLRLGQTAIAIGYTLGELKNSVSVGVVSGLVRDIWARDGWSLERLEGMIQTDAAINLGNSGGPLLNLKGEVIGINTAKNIGAESVGFAIPINQALYAIDSVLEYGEIKHPFLGIRYITVDEYEKEMRGLPIDYGALIVRGGYGQPAIDPDSPASEVGLREGDIITKMNDKTLDSENPLYNVIMGYSPGDEVEIEYLRGDYKNTVSVELAERPSD